MELGFGLYRHQLNDENLRFARQAGATRIVAHLVDYFRGEEGADRGDQPVGGDRGWGLAGDPGAIWTLDELVAFRRSVETHGMKLEAIENLDPAHWGDILLDGPLRDEQIENVKTIIRRMGEVGIPILGYNFSIAGVAGRVTGAFARGEAEAVGMAGPHDEPLPKGMVWNMIVDPNAMDEAREPISSDALWDRAKRFLNEVLPVAEEAGVRLAAHPDDPPVEPLRGQPRLVYRPDLYNCLIDLNPSPANQLEFCVGTIAEMAEGNVYDAVDEFSSKQRIGYVHLRNVRGKAPEYKESFIDEGDVDILKVLSILKENDFQGVIIPDHAPRMSCAAPWHAGMAFAMGFLKAGLKQLDAG